LGDIPANTFFKDQHPDLKADYIMANPPFNQSQWREKNELEDDSRWAGFTSPPTGNANYAWILHILSKLSENGTAGFVLDNGSMSSNTSGEGDVRRELIEKDMVDCMIALPGQLFYTTQIPVCLWFVCKNKGQRPHPENPALHYRDRRGETLFIDARQIGTMIDRTQKELTKEDIAQIAGTYHAVRKVIANREGGSGKQSPDGTDYRAALPMTFPYEDIPGYCKSASLSEIQANDFVLTPGRYVGVADEEDDGIHFEDKMTDLTATLKAQMAQAEQLDIDIRANLKVLGYE
jgi:type I restriction enzyme M protein